MKPVVFVEIDVDYCDLSYGQGNCNAAVGTTGAAKCFNTLRTCQVKDRFAKVQKTIRFGEATSRDIYPDFPFIPCLSGYNYNAGQVSLGEGIGTRSTLTVSLRDMPDSDTLEGFDKYHAERPYDPYMTGTLFGKFRARQPYLYGRRCRLITGQQGQPINEMEVRHFIIDKFDGVSLDGQYTLTAKDALILISGDKAKAPRLSNGFLVAPIDESAGQCTLSPAGIGNMEYPASGLVAIGGKEICRFTRGGDTLYLTRAQNNTAAVKHNAQDRVQICLEFQAWDPADILNHLYVNYAGVPQSMIPLSAWKNETTNFFKRLLSAVIAEPTGVEVLAAEIIQQAALANWWDDVDGLLKLQVLRKITTDAHQYTPDNTIKGSLKIKERPEKRTSQVWTYFGQINPLKKVDDADNYRSSALTAHLERQGDYGAPAIKIIYGRWIPAFGRQVALSVNAKQLGRYLDAPRQFNLDLFKSEGDTIPRLAGGYRLSSYPLQSASGLPEVVPIQITRIRPKKEGFEIEAEEFQFVEIDDTGDPDERILIIDANVMNFNFRDAYNQLFPPPASGDEVKLIIEAGAIVGSQSVDVPAFVTGSWPAGVKLNVQINGRIQGKGGNGGVTWGNRNGQYGGAALRLDAPMKVTGGGGIWGGGGGGGAYVAGFDAWGGGGGQGYLGGTGGDGLEEIIGQRANGTPERAGIAIDGVNDGSGGGAGQNGFASNAGSGGAGGAAVVNNWQLDASGFGGSILGARV